MEGNGIVPFFFFRMTIETHVKAIGEIVAQELETDPSYFLVDLRIKPTNNVKLFLDGDNGISIERCVAFNRRIYKRIEELGIFPDGDFSLEVSSPGLDEPLKLFRQYRKNLGRAVEVLLKDGRKVEGKLIEAGENELVIEETRGKNKKKEVILHNIAIDSIKHTKIQIVF
jgi:ribosome maturation factor RimP